MEAAHPADMAAAAAAALATAAHSLPTIVAVLAAAQDTQAAGHLCHLADTLPVPAAMAAAAGHQADRLRPAHRATAKVILPTREDPVAIRRDHRTATQEDQGRLLAVQEDPRDPKEARLRQVGAGIRVLTLLGQEVRLVDPLEEVDLRGAQCRRAVDLHPRL